MKRFKLNEIWVLLKWILLYEISIGIVITLLNMIFNFNDIYKSISFMSIISFEIFSLFALIIFEIMGLTQLYLIWYKKFGIKPVSKVEVLKKLLLSTEGRRIEFKKSLRWDFEKKEFNKELEKSVLKTVAGFLNSDGGNLIIGVSDKKEIEGLQKDFDTLPKKDKDGFENYLTQIIRTNIGSQRLRLIVVEFYNIDDKTVCFLKIKKSEDPVYIKLNGSEEFYVRVGNSTASLSISEAVDYVKNHWIYKETLELDK